MTAGIERLREVCENGGVGGFVERLATATQAPDSEEQHQGDSASQSGSVGEGRDPSLLNPEGEQSVRGEGADTSGTKETAPGIGCEKSVVSQVEVCVDAHADRSQVPDPAAFEVLEEGPSQSERLEEFNEVAEKHIRASEKEGETRKSKESQGGSKPKKPKRRLGADGLPLDTAYVPTWKCAPRPKPKSKKNCKRSLDSAVVVLKRIESLSVAELQQEASKVRRSSRTKKQKYFGDYTDLESDVDMSGISPKLRSSPNSTHSSTNHRMFNTKLVKQALRGKQQLKLRVEMIRGGPQVKEMRI